MPDSIEQYDSTKPKDPRKAPGSPGTKPRWTSSAKTAVGTSTSGMSHVWFTVGQGVLNELYFPDVDKANTRTVRFLVTDGEAFFSDEEHDTDHVCVAEAAGVPAFTMTNTCREGRYRITKQTVTESVRDTLLMKVKFETLKSEKPLRLFLYIQPHLGDQGEDNGAWVGEYKGLKMLMAGRENSFLACMATIPWAAATCGYVGSDAYDDLKKHSKLSECYNEALSGDISLCGELDLAAAEDGEFNLAIALGTGPAETAQIARAASMVSFAEVHAGYVRDWQQVQGRLLELKEPEGSAHPMYRISTAVMNTCESARFPGAFVASLSLPWGFARGDKDTGAYHVLWPRDLCETAMGLMAAGDVQAARRALFYLACTQNEDGSWSQNMWLDGTQHWGAIQMDGIAMPLLLAGKLRAAAELGSFDAWPMIAKAAGFLLKKGPWSEEDRWEALPGYASFTMACEIPALLAAAEFAEGAGAPEAAELLRGTADAWYDSLDALLYAKGTHLAKKYGVEGYYIRLSPPEVMQTPELDDVTMTLANHKKGHGKFVAADVVSPDAWALVRFGLRRADDPRMLATMKVVDGELRKEMTTGPGWVRSTDDGYGEHADGSPYDGTGSGRCWPLLCGERGHYEVASGHIAEAEELLRVMSRQTSECGMLPEQVWDAADIPAHSLYNGHPTGSGMPLAWAHAEYTKLVRSVRDECVWDMPPQPVERYLKNGTVSRYEIWNEQNPRNWVTAGKSLRVDFSEPVHLSWDVDGSSGGEAELHSELLGVYAHVIDLPEGWKKLKVTYTHLDGKKHALQIHVHQPAG